MATINRIYIFLACSLSTLGVILNIISLATEEWISASVTILEGTDDDDVNYLNYGLFQGNYARNFPAQTNYQLTITCSFKLNVCAFLCGLDMEERLKLLNNLYNNKTDPDYIKNCPSIRKYSYLMYPEYRRIQSRNNNNNNNEASSSIFVSPKSFINSGVWICTLIFLILAILSGIAAAAIAFINIVTNPIEYFLGVRSLFMYNVAAFSFTLFYIIIWGIHYIVRIFHNVSIYDTIEGSMNSDKTAFLGYSYWISFVSLFLYALSIGPLYYREFLNEKDPRQKVADFDNDVAADTSLYLY